MNEPGESGLLSEGAQHLRVARHACHHRPGGQQEQAGVVATHATGVHLRLEPARGGVDERSQPLDETSRRRRAETAGLAHHGEQRGVPSGHPEAGPHHRLDAQEARPCSGERPSDSSGDLVGHSVDHCRQQRLLGREPVQDRLLGQPQVAGQVVERRRLVAPSPEGAQRLVEDAVGGPALCSYRSGPPNSGHLPNGRRRW